MNNVTPSPMRRALTGVAGSDGGFGFFPEFSGFPGVLSVGLFGVFEPLLDFGRRRLGFAATPDLVVFSLGREVRNAPRTSSSSCTIGAATPITKAQTHTIPKTITLNRIRGSPCYSRAIEALSVRGYIASARQRANCAEYGCRRQSDCCLSQKQFLPSQRARRHLTRPAQ